MSKALQKCQEQWLEILEAHKVSLIKSLLDIGFSPCPFNPDYPDREWFAVYSDSDWLNNAIDFRVIFEGPEVILKVDYKSSDAWVHGSDCEKDRQLIMETDIEEYTSRMIEEYKELLDKLGVI